VDAKLKIEQEQTPDEVGIEIELFLVLPGRVETHQLLASPFEIAFMFRRDRDFMTLIEFDGIAVSLDYIHRAPLSAFDVMTQ